MKFWNNFKLQFPGLGGGVDGVVGVLNVTELVHPKIEIMSLITHPHVVTNL